MSKQDLTVALSNPPNDKWAVHHQRGLFTQAPNPILHPDGEVFTMGSCFAVEIRKWLRKLGYTPLPDYAGIEFDPSRMRMGQLPHRENINYYHTFSIRQELERCAGRWSQRPDDYWRVTDRWFSQQEAFQDPYRRAVYGRTPEDLFEAIGKLNRTIDTALRRASVFLITLGLTEVWRKTDDGGFACMNPGYAGGGGHHETEFHRSNFAENLANLETSIQIIHDISPDAHIVFTVSPVPLGRTFTGMDVVQANTESKTMLRTAAGEVARRYPQVSYFPAYDLCMSVGDVYRNDGRHVRPEIVESIMKLFLAQHRSAPPSESQPISERGHAKESGTVLVKE